MVFLLCSGKWQSITPVATSYSKSNSLAKYSSMHSNFSEAS